MSNYHVEPASKPQALTTEAIKAVRHEQVQGVSRRELLRGSLAAGMGLWLLEVTAGTHRLPVAEPRGQVRRRRPRSGRSTTSRPPNSTLPVDEGFPAYFSSAKAFVILVDPAQQRFIPGEDATGDGTSVNVRALYQRCPHLGCKPNPCEKNFWLECPCHGSRYDRLGVKAAGAQYGPAPRGMDRFAVKVDGAGVLTINTGKITLGPLPVARRPAGDHPAAHAHRLHLIPSRHPPVRPPRRPMTDQPGRPPEERLPAPRPSSAPVPAERFSAPPSAHRNDLTPERAGEDRPPVRERAVGGLPGRDDRRAVRHRLLLLRARRCRAGCPSRGWTQAANEQQVVAVERGYNLYQANCAQCHGVDGEGGIGPDPQPPGQAVRPPQPGLPAQRPRRSAAGTPAATPNSIMPVWSNTGNPPGPAQLQADRGPHRLHPGRARARSTGCMDPGLFEPVMDPATGEEKTFEGWVDPELQARARRDAVPGLLVRRVRRPGAPPRPAASAAGASGEPGASQAPAARSSRSPRSTSRSSRRSSAPRPTPPFQIEFDNQDAGIPHNVEIKDASGAVRLQGRDLQRRRRQDLRRAGPRRRHLHRSSARCTRT